MTAIFASARHLPGIAAGDAIGASATMLTDVEDSQRVRGQPGDHESRD